MAKNNNDLAKRGLKYFARIGEMAVMRLATRRARVMVMAVFVIIGLWFLFNNVWRELQQEVGLPPRVADEKSEIDIEALRSINMQRPERTGKKRSNYTVFNHLFE